MILSGGSTTLHTPNVQTFRDSQHEMPDTSSILAEVDKWKKFGYLMAESYDELKKETEKLKGEKDKDRKIVVALKEQIDKLK